MTTTQPNIRPVRKILIANRGEIAVRVIRACRELGIDLSRCIPMPIAVRCMSAWPTRLIIGPPPPRESYLDMDKVADTAVKAGADAVASRLWFLSERAEFVEACENAD